jgi:hypothetical protein
MLYAVGNRVSHSEKTKLILGGAEMRRLIIILAKVAEQLALVLPRPGRRRANCLRKPRACGELVSGEELLGSAADQREALCRTLERERSSWPWWGQRGLSQEN